MQALSRVHRMRALCTSVRAGDSADVQARKGAVAWPAWIVRSPSPELHLKRLAETPELTSRGRFDVGRRRGIRDSARRSASEARAFEAVGARSY